MAATKQSGFTIVELVMIVVVLAILVGVSIGSYYGIQTRARTSAADSGIATAIKKITAYKIFKRTFPLTAADADISNTASVYFQYTSNGMTYCVTASSGPVDRFSQDGVTPISGTCTGHTAQAGIGTTN